MKCRKKGHVMREREIPRTWTKEDGTVQFKVYVQVYCETCKKAREKESQLYRDLKKHRKEVMERQKYFAPCVSI